MPLYMFKEVLNQRNGRPYRYWRVFIGYDDQRWQKMRSSGFIALQLHKIGDLTNHRSSNYLKSIIKEYFDELYHDMNEVFHADANQLYNFVAAIQSQDSSSRVLNIMY